MGELILSKYNERGHSYDRNQKRRDPSMYQHGSAARELAPQYDEVPDYDRDMHRVKRPSTGKKKKKSTTQNNRTRSNPQTATRTRSKVKSQTRRHPIVITPLALKSVAMVILIFAGAIAFMTTKVQVDNVSFEIRQANEELKNLQDMNAILSAELANEVDLDYIKSEAVNRLGMADPQPYQIIHIDVPKTGYTVQYTDATD